MENLGWFHAPYKELPLDLLYDLLAFRQKIFVVEQHCVYTDIDEVDKNAYHLIVQKKDNGRILAYARIIAAGVVYSEASVGRVCVDAEYRKSGLGKALMLKALDLCRTLFGESPIKIGAQCYLQGFYESFGFKVIGEPYNEDGIFHIHMIL